MKEYRQAAYLVSVANPKDRHQIVLTVAPFFDRGYEILKKVIDEVMELEEAHENKKEANKNEK